MSYVLEAHLPHGLCVVFEEDGVEHDDDEEEVEYEEGHVVVHSDLKPVKEVGIPGGFFGKIAV